MSKRLNRPDEIMMKMVYCWHKYLACIGAGNGPSFRELPQHSVQPYKECMALRTTS